MISRISHLILALTLGLFFLFLQFLLVVLPVRAVDLTVLNTNDSGPGSLRQAIADAGNGDTILFDSSFNGQTITLTSGQLLVTKNLTINGPGANLLAVSGNNASRVFLITSTVTISGMTIKEGLAFPVLVFPGGGIYNSGTLNLINSTVFSNAVNSLSVGGGIFNSGTANLVNSTVFSNTATSGGGIHNTGFSSIGTLNLINSAVFSNTGRLFGGGIENNLGTVNLTNSVVFSNMASGGGGIHNHGTANLTSSTVSGNTGVDNGGGIWVDHFSTANLTNSTISGNTSSTGGGIDNYGTTNLINSTVSGNTGDGGIWNEGGNLNLINSTILSNTGGYGISNRFGTMTLTNTVLAYNLGKDCTNLSGATVTSSGYNLVQAPDNCVFSAIGDITNTNPLLGPLAHNGGDTLTHALLDGSPAIDHIPKGANGCGTTITIDQRGVVRPQGTRCDIGAYEVVTALNFNLHLPLIFKN